ncbi:unnamed protein product [Phyllotreta striolata]|uniref:Uncharacterized protein n=1 Tax=Phyllotreta striolata TaxID=444603 RepID=A0A9N9TLQ5_PHYSR|nr:unnamed protein product [Phyllotreta striolata]
MENKDFGGGFTQYLKSEKARPPGTAPTEIELRETEAIGGRPGGGGGGGFANSCPPCAVGALPSGPAGPLLVSASNGTGRVLAVFCGTGYGDVPGTRVESPAMGRSRMVWPTVLVTLLALGWAFAGSPGAGGSYLGDVNVSAILDSFSVSYDKRVRPNYGGPPVVVGVTMYVLSISSLSEVKMVDTHTTHVKYS